jgi:hypothetical protein
LAFGVCAFALALVIAISPSAAADPPAPTKPRPAHWRVMTYDDATSTSRCIGDPRTPLCAIETHMACFFRRQPPLCPLAHGLPESAVNKFNVARPDRRVAALKIEYRVLRIHQVKSPDPRLARNINPPAPGDIEVRVIDRSCSSVRSTCGGERTYEYYFRTRHTADGWRIIGFAAKDAPD